jgi:hypothetical protein
MVDPNVPEELSADRLMQFVQHLSVVIGPRHPASQAEHEAAAYVRDATHRLNRRWEEIDQPFHTVDGFRYRVTPLAMLTGLSLFLGLRRSRNSRLVSGLLATGLSVMSRDAFLARPPIWEARLARRESQNVIVRIPPRRAAQRRIVFIAHLDSGTHHLSADPHVVRQLPRTLGGTTLMALVGGVLTVLAGKNQRWRVLRALIAGGALGGAALAVADESGSDVAGANGNASGVAVLLGLAEALNAYPPDVTEVMLAFTGSASAVSTGADVLATEFGNPWHDALWVVVSHVGAGELCWVTRHGISPYAYYAPHPDAVQIMERAADARPDLGMMGKPVLSLDEVSILRDRDLRAVALMACDRATGLIPHWRQNGDTIHEINPETVERAAHACWTITQVIDHSDTWPPS